MRLLLTAILCFTSLMMFSQDSKLIKNPNKENKFSIGISGGNYTQILGMKVILQYLFQGFLTIHLRYRSYLEAIFTQVKTTTLM